MYSKIFVVSKRTMNLRRETSVSKELSCPLTSHRISHTLTAGLTLEDLCRCMVGAWPTQLDLDGSGRKPWITSNNLLQPIIGGVPLPFPLLDAQPTQPDANESSSTIGCGGGSSSPVMTPLPRQICSEVVFRGPIGRDRAVRANLPFPWMDEFRLYDVASNRKDQRSKPEKRSATAGLHRKIPFLTRNSIPMMIDYPHTFLAHVKHGAPFATLWPGHSAGKDVKVRLCSGYGKDVGAGGGSMKEGDDPMTSQREEENIDVLVERLPSSGPTAFFYAGYTAYYEITLGGPLRQLAQNVEWGLPRDQCVAIGLATQHFPLE